MEHLSRRVQFDHLRAHATTQRVGQLRVSFAPWDASIGPAEPAIAFAVPRRFGTAVQRNRVRRRLRAIVWGMEREQVLPRGWLLVGVIPRGTEPSSRQLGRWLESALDRLAGNPGVEAGAAASSMSPSANRITGVAR